MAKTNRQKQAEFRQRHAAAGRQEMRGIYARPEHREQIRAFAESLHEADAAGAFTAPKELTQWLTTRH
jgi:hypothetical protein